MIKMSQSARVKLDSHCKNCVFRDIFQGGHINSNHAQISLLKRFNWFSKQAEHPGEGVQYEKVGDARRLAQRYKSRILLSLRVLRIKPHIF